MQCALSASIGTKAAIPLYLSAQQQLWCSVPQSDHTGRLWWGLRCPLVLEVPVRTIVTKPCLQNMQGILPLCKLLSQSQLLPAGSVRETDAI
jgi:hypothetical protein